MRMLLAFLVLLASCRTDRRKMYDQAVAPVVQLTEDGAEDGACGSGVVVYQDDSVALIVTANHVAIHLQKARATINSGTVESFSAVAKLVLSDPEHDLAVFAAAPGWPSVAKLAGAVEPLAQAIAVGYPADFKCVDIVPGILSPDMNGPQQVTSNSIIPGMSGGGIFVKESGDWLLFSIIQAAPAFGQMFGGMAFSSNHESLEKIVLASIDKETHHGR